MKSYKHSYRKAEYCARFTLAAQALLLYNEDMIPIVSIAHLVSVFASSVLSFRFFRNNRKNPSVTLKHFAWFYLLFALTWLFGASSYLFLNDALSAGIANLMNFLFLYASVAVGIYVPFSFIGRPIFGSIAVFIVMLGGVVFLLGRIYYFPDQVLIIERIPPFIYLRITFPGWLRLMTGAINAAASLIFIAIFLRLGIKNKLQPTVYYRSLALAGGMALLFLGNIFVYLSPTPSLPNVAIASILAASGLLTMAHGIVHEHKAALQIK